MGIINGFKKVQDRIKTSAGYQAISHWTHADTVVYDRVVEVNPVISDAGILTFTESGNTGSSSGIKIFNFLPEYASENQTINVSYSITVLSITNSVGQNMNGSFTIYGTNTNSEYTLNGEGTIDINEEIDPSVKYERYIRFNGQSGFGSANMHYYITNNNYTISQTMTEKFNAIDDSMSDMSAKIGNPADLTTSASNAMSAISEVNSLANNNKNVFSDMFKYSFVKLDDFSIGAGEIKNATVDAPRPSGYTPLCLSHYILSSQYVHVLGVFHGSTQNADDLTSSHWNFRIKNDSDSTRSVDVYATIIFVKNGLITKVNDYSTGI